MSDTEKKNNGIEAINDDELDAVAGGANFERCPRKQFEIAFPEKQCKGCEHLRCWPQPQGDFVFECKFFKTNERKDKNPWNFDSSFKW